MFAAFKYILDSVRKDIPDIDHYVFKLHYQVTVPILVSFSIILTTYSLVGSPIYCTSGTRIISEEMLNQFCWITGSFTHPNLEQVTDNSNRLSPGLIAGYDDSPKRYINFYQWIWLILLFQAFAFYIPRYFWKISEGNLVNTLCKPANVSILDTEQQAKYVSQLQLCFLRKYHNGYVIKFIFCEILNELNVLLQFYIIEYFTEGTILEYSIKILEMLMKNFNERDDRLAVIFPVLSTCYYKSVGNSGSIQFIDALCLLPLNALNEKIFIFLWFWFAVVAILTTISLLYRFLIICSPTMRYCSLKWKIPYHRRAVKMLCHKMDLGDWFLLILLSKNMYKGIHEELVKSLTEKIEMKTNKKVDKYLED